MSSHESPDQARQEVESSKPIEVPTGWGDLSQGRAVVWTAAGVIFLADLLMIVLLLVGEVGFGAREIGTLVIDVFLGLNLLRGKRWARTWILVRVVLGLIVYGIILGSQQDYGGLAVQAGYCVTMLLLLIGTGGRKRAVAGITVFIVSLAVGFTLVVAAPLSTAETEPLAVIEPKVPSAYTTYTSEGLFSIAYPPDWMPAPDEVMEEVAGASLEWLRDVDPQSAARLEEESRYLFIAGFPEQDGFYPTVTIVVAARHPLTWTVDAVAQSEGLWAHENLEDYHEFSQLKTIVGGREAIIVDWKNYEADFGTWRYLTLYSIKDSIVWVVICGCEVADFQAFGDTFDHVLRSLRILK